MVVCDLRSVVAAWMAVRGPLGRSAGAMLESAAAGVLEGVREVWKCVRRVCVVWVREMSLGMSFGGGIVASAVMRVCGKERDPKYEEREVCIKCKTRSQNTKAGFDIHKKCRWFWWGF